MHLHDSWARTMTKVLAPSKIGGHRSQRNVKFRWLPSIAYPWQWVNGNALQTILWSYKSPTKKSDGRVPTAYCRMINKIIPGGAVDCDNVYGFPTSNRYYYKSDSSCTVSVKSGPNLPYGSDIGNGNVGVPGWLRDAAIAAALQDMSGISANIYEDLGQAAEPLKLYVNTYRHIILLYLSARAGRWKYVRRVFRELGRDIPRSIGNGWLMYFYGVRPLMSTLETLVSENKPRQRRYKVRTRRSTTAPMTDYVAHGSGVLSSDSCDVSVQCQLEAMISISADMSYYYKLGITGNPTDAVITAWALTPWSFVVDWIIPVEQFLLSLTWVPGLVYQGGFVGQRHYGNASYIDFMPWSGGPIYSGTLPTYRHQVRFYQRIPYPYTVPPVGLNAKFSLNSNQIISAVALIATR